MTAAARTTGDPRGDVRTSRGLGATAARGARTTISAQVAKLAVRVGGLVLMARFLTPDDYGLVAMVLVVAGVAEVLRDVGLSSAVVQARSVSTRQRDNLWWASTGLGALMGGAVLALSGTLASWYGEPLLADIARALAVTFVVNGAAAQFRAGLNRDMAFRKLAAVEVSSQVVGVATGIACAVAGLGYWALIAQQVVQAVCALAVLVAVAGWWPGVPRRGHEIRSFLAYGVNLLGTQLLGYASRNVDAVVIGTQFGAAPLGVYNRAFQLLALPIGQLSAPATSVALPVLSRIRDDVPRFGRYLVRASTVLMQVTVPMFLLAIAVAEPLVELVLGAQWLESAALFRILAVAGSFQAAGFVTYWVFLATGRTASNLRFALVTRPVVIGLVVVGGVHSVAGVAAGYALGVVVTWAMGLAWVRRVDGVDSRLLAGTLLRPLVTHLPGTLAGAAAVSMLRDAPLWLELGAGAGAFAVPSLVVLALWPRSRADLRAALGVRTLLRARTAGSPTETRS